MSALSDNSNGQQGTSTNAINMTAAIISEQLKPLRMTLNGNTLKFRTGKGWILDSSDLDSATLEIENLLDEKDQLSMALKDAYDQIEELHREVVQTNEAKSVILEMLMNERQQRINLEADLIGYKDELKQSYKALIELKNAIAKEDES